MKLFFKNTHLDTFFSTKEYPFFYSTYYAQSFSFKKESIKNKIKNLSFCSFSEIENFLSTNKKNSSFHHHLLKQQLTILQNQIHQTSLPNITLPFFAPKALKALQLYQKAQYNIYQTDFKSASENLSLALKTFKSQKHFFECGLCYLSLAQIYKICGCFDIAHTMLCQAQKIFTDHIFCPSLIVEIKGYLGLNELYYENYDNALAYLKEALTTAQKYNFSTQQANIQNWIALTHLLTKNLDLCLSSIPTSSSSLPLPTKLFKYEILSHAYKQKQNLPLSLKYINKALPIAKLLNNEKELFELTFSKAEVYYQASKLNKAKTIATNLLKNKYSTSLSLYKANAYNLLGLIAIKENDLKRAKNLFKLSLDLENSKSRNKGIAIDYNNLAFIAQKQGNQEETNYYQKLALQSAKETNDEELISFLTQQISSN